MIIKVCEARRPVSTAAGSVARRSWDANLGRSMGGLVRYLVGPGKANEHTNPTLVAASDPLDQEYGDVDFEGPWAKADTAALVAQLNKPMRDRRGRGDLPEDRGFVFHAVMSLPPGTSVPHEQWAAMAHDYISAMGFDESENKAPCRWAAFHHGDSAEGNDHLHVVVMMIRDDGTWASNAHTKRRSMTARKEITAKYGLMPAEEAARQRDRVPYEQPDLHSKTIIGRDGQVQITRRDSGTPSAAADAALSGGRDEPDNDKLRRLMVAAAGQSSSEADYIKSLWRSGVLTRPYYAAGTTDVVTGYSVALRHGSDERSRWRAAGSVHKSLRLPHLRQGWRDDPAAASEAAATWHTYRGEMVPPPPAIKASVHQPAAAAAEQIRQLNAELGSVRADDLGRWAQVSRDTAAVLAQASLRYEDKPGPLGRASEALLRDAELDPAMVYPARHEAHVGLARSVRLLVQATSRFDAMGWVAVLEQLSHTMAAIVDARRQQEQAERAQYLADRTAEAVVLAAQELAAEAPSAAEIALNTGAAGAAAAPRVQTVQTRTSSPHERDQR